MSVGTYSLKPTLKDRFFLIDFHCNFIYSQSFWQKSNVWPAGQWTRALPSYIHVLLSPSFAPLLSSHWQRCEGYDQSVNFLSFFRYQKLFLAKCHHKDHVQFYSRIQLCPVCLIFLKLNYYYYILWYIASRMIYRRIDLACIMTWN